MQKGGFTYQLHRCQHVHASSRFRGSTVQRLRATELVIDRVDPARGVAALHAFSCLLAQQPHLGTEDSPWLRDKPGSLTGVNIHPNRRGTQGHVS